METLRQLGVSLKSQPAGYVFTTDNYDIFQVIVVNRGRVRYTDERVSKDLGHGEMMVLRPESRFELMTPTGGYAGVCALTSDIHEWMPGASFPCSADPEVRVLALQIDEEIRRPKRNHSNVNDAQGMLLVEYARRAIDKHHAPPELSEPEHWAEYARRAITSSLYTNRKVSEILASAPLSYRQIARHFQSQTGQSLKDFQLQAKINEARRLLDNPNASITSVALELGFPSSQHFSTCFKRLTNLSPSQYQRKVIMTR